MATSSEHLEHGLILAGFYGTLTFTALVLVLSFPERWKFDFYGISGDLYSDGLVTLLSAVSSLCVFSSLGFFLLSRPGKRPAIDEKIGTFVATAFFISQILLLAVFPLMLVPFTRYGALIVFAVELSFSVWLVYPSRKKKVSRTITPTL